MSSANQKQFIMLLIKNMALSLSNIFYKKLVYQPVFVTLKRRG